MKFPSKLIAIFISVTLLNACSLPQKGPVATPTQSVATIVAGTLQALIPSVTPMLPTQPLPSSTSTLEATPTLPPPTLTSAPSLTPTKDISPTPSITPIPDPGSISGTISGYPYGSLPALAIVAIKQDSPRRGNYSYFITAPGGTFFSMSTSYLIPGQWMVIAYDSSGNSGGCSGPVTVVSNQTVSCTISDWASAFPPKPAGVPNP
jgi:hypothetical protein